MKKMLGEVNKKLGEATGGGTERATEAARMSAVTPLRLRDVVTRRHKKSEQEDWRNLLAR